MKTALFFSFISIICAVIAFFGQPAVYYHKAITGVDGLLLGLLYAVIPPAVVYVYKWIKAHFGHEEEKSSTSISDQTSISSRKRRPIGLRLISLALCWLAIGAAMMTWCIFYTPLQERLPSILGVVAAAYGVTALAAVVGLVRLELWGMWMLRAWMAITLVGMAIFAMTFKKDILGGAVGGLLFGLFFIWILWAIDKNVRKWLIRR